MTNNIIVHLTTLGNIRTSKLVADCRTRQLETCLARDKDLNNRVYDLMTTLESLSRECNINLGGTEVLRLSKKYRKTLKCIHRILRQHIKAYDKYTTKEVAV